MDKIAILCSGGDVSGMNPAIKRFVEYSFAKGMQPFFVYNGYEGLIDNNIHEAHYEDVAGIMTRTLFCSPRFTDTGSMPLPFNGDTSKPMSASA